MPVLENPQSSRFEHDLREPEKLHVNFGRTSCYKNSTVTKQTLQEKTNIVFMNMNLIYILWMVSLLMYHNIYLNNKPSIYSVITQLIPIWQIDIVNKIWINIIFMLFTSSWNFPRYSPRIKLFIKSPIWVNLKREHSTCDVISSESNSLLILTF